MMRYTICLAFAFFLGACSSGTPVAFHNASGHKLEEVVLSGPGFNADLGVVDPGQTLTAHVDPSGESGLAVSFKVNGRTVRHGSQGYFEGGGRYEISATVRPDLTVAVRSKLGP